MVAPWGNHHRDSPWFTTWISVDEIPRRRTRMSGPTQLVILAEPIEHLKKFNLGLSKMKLCADSSGGPTTSRMGFDSRRIDRLSGPRDARSSALHRNEPSSIVWPHRVRLETHDLVVRKEFCGNTELLYDSPWTSDVASSRNHCSPFNLA